MSVVSKKFSASLYSMLVLLLLLSCYRFQQWLRQ